jgi:hypothetical protein
VAARDESLFLVEFPRSRTVETLAWQDADEYKILNLLFEMFSMK